MMRLGCIINMYKDREGIRNIRSGEMGILIAQNKKTAPKSGCGFILNWKV